MVQAIQLPWSRRGHHRRVLEVAALTSRHLAQTCAIQLLFSAFRCPFVACQHLVRHQRLPQHEQILLHSLLGIETIIGMVAIHNIQYLLFALGDHIGPLLAHCFAQFCVIVADFVHQLLLLALVEPQVRDALVSCQVLLEAQAWLQ